MGPAWPMRRRTASRARSNTSSRRAAPSSSRASKRWRARTRWVSARRGSATAATDFTPAGGFAGDPTRARSVAERTNAGHEVAGLPEATGGDALFLLVLQGHAFAFGSAD